MTDYNVGSGQELTGLVLGSSDSVTVASGGLIFLTTDNGGTETLNGGVGVATAILDGGKENVEGGGIAVGSLIESNSSITVTGNSSMYGSIIESGATAFIGSNDPSSSGSPTDNDTLINGGTEVVGSFTGAGTAVNDIVQAGGQQNILEGLAKGTIINSGGTQTVSGQATGTVVNAGGVQAVTGGDASFGSVVSSVLNSGALQTVQHGNSQQTVINGGATETVGGMGNAEGSIINGGTLDLGSDGGASNGIQFTGTGGALDIGGTVTPTTAISGFAATDRIDLQGFGYSSAASVSLGSNNILSITGLTGGTATLTLDPNASYDGMAFTLASDGKAGTLLTVGTASQASAMASTSLSNIRAAATAAGDPLGLKATFTTAVATALAPAAMTLPDLSIGSAHAASILAGAAATAHIPLLSEHHTVAG